MADDFSKVFNKLHAEAASAAEAEDAELQLSRKKEREERLLREREGPMTAQDAVPRILQAWKDSDYFKCAPHYTTYSCTAFMWIVLLKQVWRTCGLQSFM